jgi:hypothetical protein
VRQGFIAGLGTAGLFACLHTPAVAQDEELIDRTPRNCISTNRISYTRVVDDWTVLFYMSGRTVYRNTLQHECRGLESRDRFAYSTRTGRLCNVDFVTIPGGTTCTLGQFHPITREEARMIQLDPEELEAINRSVEVEQVELPPEDAADGLRPEDAQETGDALEPR